MSPRTVASYARRVGTSIGGGLRISPTTATSSPQATARNGSRATPRRRPRLRGFAAHTA
jgi:hypothetical protein